MRAVVQRVTQAAVVVDGETVGRVGAGLLVLLCAEQDDTDEDTAFFARKIAHMRIFTDDQGRINRSVIDIGGSVLVASQFTLAARWRKGNRPSLSGAATPERGERLYNLFRERLEGEGVPVQTGRFGAHMKVGLVNDGPVTIWMNSNEP